MPPSETPTGEEAIDRQHRKRQPIYVRMYFDPCCVEFVRFIGYGGKPLAEAQQFILELEKKYGREKVIEAGEAVSTCEGKAENMVVRLTAEARRLAWQLLGPPPEHKATDTVPETSSGERLKPETTPTEKPKKPLEPRARKAMEAPPLLQQYREAKKRHPGMLLLFRMGDFYELFDEDAELAAKDLGLTLTTRDKTISMAGFPHHCLETNLRKLLQAGHRVAICEQVQETRPRGPIRREVTRVVTPGTMIEEAPAPPPSPPQEMEPCRALDPSLSKLNRRQLRCRLRDARKKAEHNGTHSFVGKQALSDMAAVYSEMCRRGMEIPEPGQELPEEQRDSTAEPPPPPTDPEEADSPAAPAEPPERPRKFDPVKLRSEADRAVKRAHHAREYGEYPRFGESIYLELASALRQLADTVEKTDPAIGTAGLDSTARQARRAALLQRKAAYLKVQALRKATESHDIASRRPFGQPIT